MKRLEELSDQIEKSMERLHFSGEPANLYDPLNYILSLGGKRMRPLLTLLGCDLFHGDIKKAVQPALGIEVFHNFTLLHDDIMDQAPLRRGQATVHKKWNEPTAILSGDLMLVKAYELMMKVDGVQMVKVLELFNQTAAGVCEGQQMDMDFEKSDSVSVNDYIQMITLKTAVLLGCGLKTGALVASAHESDADLLYDYGVNMGIGFQLMDDVLDVYGDTAKVGKQVAGDILSDKKTWLLLKAFELAEGEDLAILNKWVGERDTTKSEEKIAAVKGVYERLNIRQLATELSENYFLKAERLLDAIPVEKERKLPLLAYSELIKERVS
ncbi:MAG: polyprenyl synthetase family protein [Bacteroidetes bacterium]|nr:MAG: polyprenyl synthetase family protein [Bacteroidota bacterium]